MEKFKPFKAKDNSKNLHNTVPKLPFFINKNKKKKKKKKKKNKKNMTLRQMKQCIAIVAFNALGLTQTNTPCYSQH
jgi:hypothetical protein